MLEFFLFVFAFFLSIFVPGTLALYPLKRTRLELFVLGSVIGISLLALQGYLFGIFSIRWMSYFYILVTFALWIYFYKNKIKHVFQIKTKGFDWVGLSIVLLGTLVALSAVWFINYRTGDGIYFCCRGVPDAIYHLSLTNELIREFPPYEPGMNGVLVKNYHFLSNLVVAEISRIFKLDFVRVQFQFMTLFLALILGGSAFVLGNLLKLGKIYSRWLALFLFFSGDILYILLFLRNKGFDFSVTVLDDATKLFAGPPRAFSVVLFFGGLSLFLIWIRRKDLYSGLLMALVMGLLFGFKVYTGLFVLSGFFVLGIWYLFRKKILMTFPLFVSAVISTLYHFKINKGAGGLSFSGMWRFENFIQHKDLALSKLDYLRLTYLHENNFILLIGLELLFIIIYFVFLFGVVNLGLFQSKKYLRIFPKEFNIFLVSSILLSLIAGSFFVQKTGGANTVQFIIAVFIVAPIYTSLALYYWLPKFNRFLALAVMVAVIVFTVPRAIHEGSVNLSNIINGEGVKISGAQLNSLEYLRNETPPNSVYVVEPWMAEDQPFIYTTYTSNRLAYLSGAGLLRDHGHDTKNRERVVDVIYNNSNAKVVESLLRRNSIDYLYISPGIKLASIENANFLEKVFEEEEFRIYKVL